MTKNIKIKIDNKPVSCTPDITIMEAAAKIGIDIPGLCKHENFKPAANCRVCVVEIKGWKNLQTSCSTKVTDGMEIFTNSARVKKSRNLNIELIFAEHAEKCATCIWRFECPLLAYAREYNVEITRFKDRKNKRKTYKFANAVEIDGSQCIDCKNCVSACSLIQNINHLEIKGKGRKREITPTKGHDTECILCGQCTLHCPVSAAQEQSDWEKIEKDLKNEKKVVVAQFAPSIRVSIGECFNMPHGKVVTGHVTSALRELGFNYVFDVNFAADITTIIEADELINRITNKGIMPMITSCCPGWVNYAEIYHPEILPNLTTARSPQIHGGGLIKTYWAKKMGIDPKDIIVVSVMPCTAKKYEAARPEMKVDGNLPVDYVITTREFSFLLKKNKIDFPKLKKSQNDSPLGEYSGAGAIFGGSGGVMESALRTAHHVLTKSNSGIGRSRIDFKSVRGLEDVKEATIKINDLNLRVAVVNGIKNVEKVIDKLDKYDYIEVMACPGGCIGGGGQPIPTTLEIRKKRIAALYKIDKDSKIRKSTDNVYAVEVLDWLKKQDHLEHKVLHTKYKKRIKY